MFNGFGEDDLDPVSDFLKIVEKARTPKLKLEIQSDSTRTHRPLPLASYP